MNYQKIHDQIINRALTEARLKNNGIYYEQHHIIPRCLGGTDTQENLVLLTAREHFIVHKLLCEIYPDNQKLLHAYWLLSNKLASKGQYRIYTVSNREYNRLKIEIAEISKKMNTGRIYSDDIKKKMSEIKTGKKRKPFTEEHKCKISEAKKGHKSGMFGKQHSIKTKKKMSATRKKKK